MMKRMLPKLAWGTLFTSALCLGVFLVAFNILNAANIPFDALLAKIFSPVSKPEVTAQQHDEVRSYTLFTSVKHDTYTVTTGTRYGSSRDQIIQSQWCYIAVSAEYGGIETHLPLARISIGGKRIFPPYKTSALQKFKLTASTAKALVNSHCRFQQPERI